MGLTLTPPAPMLPPFDEIQANFEFLDEPDDRLDYLIELGRLAPTLPEELKTEANQVRGCLSQVWLVTDVERKDGRTRLIFRGDSDAITTRGIVALIIAIYSGRSPQEVRATDALDIFRRLGLSDHITSKRSNGARAMVERIHRDAESALAA
jgi:cysteine desulfuration protein SufE